MSRPLRIELAGGLYHVTSRGDRRGAMFRGDQDREDWLTVLGAVGFRFNWRCHAYCEMTNHYHVVVATPDANLSKGMRQVNGVYTQRLNRRHGLVGHLIRGRFKAMLVERSPTTCAPTPVVQKPRPAPSSPAFSPCRKSQSISACTILPYAAPRAGSKCAVKKALDRKAWPLFRSGEEL
jgi:REP element-mobilizing transposase RayT